MEDGLGVMEIALEASLPGVALPQVEWKARPTHRNVRQGIPARSGSADRVARCPNRCGYLQETSKTLIANLVKLTETWDGMDSDTRGHPADQS
jgi:hypothetical protein